MDQFAHLKETLEKAPTEPGVYKMKSADGKTLYIGKAKSLRSRVRSYFHAGADHSPRITLMVRKARSIEYIVTSSEMEALVLEDNLIKKERPTYNVMLKDDKNYPYLKLTMSETFPRLVFVRKVEKDSGMYFGPYVSAKSVRNATRLIHKIFPLRQSKDVLDGKEFRRPCLNYQMGRCLAPCAGKTSEIEYRGLVDEVILFLKGRNQELLETLHSKMVDASDKEWYEQAARYRDQIEAINRLNERQLATQVNLADQDVIAAYERAGKSIIKIFQVRRGKIAADKSFMFDKLERQDRAEALGAFIRQFYIKAMPPPAIIIVNEIPDGVEALTERLSAIRKTKVKIELPLKGKKKKLLEMAERNARIQLETYLSSLENREKALQEIRNAVGTNSGKLVIEGYDISNTGGVSSVGAVVVFKEGVPSKSDYRKYNIKTVTGPDDYKSMAEIIERRHRRLMDSGKPFADLLVIDGGKGQVKAVMKRFAAMKVDPPKVIGISKGKERENSDTDEFHTPEGESDVDFPPSAPGRMLLQQVRDEAHRFAISFHRGKRGQAMMKSVLDDAPGVGPKRKKMLLKKFGSVKRIREATVEQLQEALSVSEKTARKIHESL